MRRFDVYTDPNITRREATLRGYGSRINSSVTPCCKEKAAERLAASKYNCCMVGTNPLTDNTARLAKQYWQDGRRWAGKNCCGR